MLGGQSVLDGWVSNKPGADRGPEGGVPVKDMVKGGAGQPKARELIWRLGRSCGVFVRCRGRLSRRL